jgi:hypothetical protein
MMGNEAYDALIGTEATQMPRPVDRMKASVHQLWRIADVMEPCRSDQQVFRRIVVRL